MNNCYHCKNNCNGTCLSNQCSRRKDCRCQRCIPIPCYQGPPGPPGPQGVQGSRGPIGPQGPIGLKGDPGPQGQQGQKGNVGPQGYTGADGQIGQTGSTGETGSPGMDGSTGEIGPQGYTGEFGSGNFTWQLFGSAELINSSTITNGPEMPWSSGGFSVEGYTNNVFMSFKPNQIQYKYFVAGLTETKGPLSQGLISYGWFIDQFSDCYIIEAGFFQIGPIAISTSDFFTVAYEGDYVNYYKSGELIFSSYRAISTNLLYLGIVLGTYQSQVNNIHFSLIGGGYTGPQGEIGPQGYTGDIGPQGYTGEIGSQGISGVDGAVSLRYILEDVSGGDPSGATYFTTCCNINLIYTNTFRLHMYLKVDYHRKDFGIL